MITYNGDILNITCDKCGTKSSCNKDKQEILFNEGWAFSRGAKKYTHLCYSCQSRKSKQAHDFIAHKRPWRSFLLPILIIGNIHTNKGE
jgi:hypothetical protein